MRNLDADHLVVAALALPVDALVQAEHPEDVFVDLARQVLADGFPEARELVVDLGIERSGSEVADVDRHRYRFADDIGLLLQVSGGIGDENGPGCKIPLNRSEL